jgi:ribosomal protein S18 acetylase RimI-like enzyme
MPGIDVETFAEAHLDEAARLLQERHSRHREAEPLLPGQVDFRAELASLLADGGSGAVARRDGRAVGYVLGNRRGDEIWGPNVWVELAGHAVEEAEDIRDLYAFAAERWVEEGRTRHQVLVPASDDALVGAWFRLGFGQQQAHAVREVPAKTDVRVPNGFQIRRPRADEVDALLELDLALPRHQQRAPVFSARPLPTEDELREEWVKTLGDSDEEVLIGYMNGRPVACWSFVPAARSSHHGGALAPTDGTAYLAFAVTLPEARGSGIGVALTQATMAAAAEQGYETMVTDWRVTNLLASRFWPRRGFRETFLRLHRSIP